MFGVGIPLCGLLLFRFRGSSEYLQDDVGEALLNPLDLDPEGLFEFDLSLPWG